MITLMTLAEAVGALQKDVRALQTQESTAPSGSSLVTGAGANTRVALWSGTSTLTSDADITFDGSQLALPVQGSTGGVLLGGDVLLYRGAADRLQTPDNLVVDGGIYAGTTGSTAGAVVAALNLQSRTDGSTGGVFAGSSTDVQWYRNAADVWRTPDSVIADGYLEANGSNSGVGIKMTRASGNQVGLEFAQTGVGNALLYMPASTNKLIFQSGGNNNLAIDHANRRIGIKNDSPSYSLDVNGDGNFEGVLHTNGATTPTSMASGFALKNDTAPASSPTDQVAIYAGDAGGTAGKSWGLMRPEDGVARTIMGAKDHQGVSSGTGTVKMNGATSRNSVGWLETHDEDGTTIYIPYWTTVTG